MLFRSVSQSRYNKPYKDGVEKYSKELITRFNHGELLHADSIHFPDSLRYQTIQLKRNVYGGGGIMPDIFVPLDTTFYSEYYNRIGSRGIINKVVIQYIDQNRAVLKRKYPKFEKFNASFQTNDEVLEKLKLLAEKEKIEFNSAQFETSKPLIKLQIKALIARDLWEMNEYYQVIDVENESLKKAIQILQTPGTYESLLK